MGTRGRHAHNRPIPGTAGRSPRPGGTAPLTSTTMLTSDPPRAPDDGPGLASAPPPDVLVDPATAPVSIGGSIARGALALLTVQPITWGVSLLGAIAIPSLLGSDALG